MCFTHAILEQPRRQRRQIRLRAPVYAVFTPKSQNWIWYADDAAEPTSALSSENTTFTRSDNTSKLRLRWTIKETGGTTGSNQAVDGAYSTDQSTWTDFAAGGALWIWADGQATDLGNTTTFKTTDGTTHGKYHESSGGLETWAANAARELDLCIKENGAAAGTLYYFQFKLQSAGVALNSGKTYPNLTTFSAAGQPTVKRWGGIVAAGPSFERNRNVRGW